MSCTCQGGEIRATVSQLDMCSTLLVSQACFLLKDYLPLIFVLGFGNILFLVDSVFMCSTWHCQSVTGYRAKGVDVDGWMHTSRQNWACAPHLIAAVQAEAHSATRRKDRRLQKQCTTIPPREGARPLLSKHREERTERGE